MGIRQDLRGEGIANTIFNLARELSKEHQVLCLSIKEVFKPSFWFKLRDFKPDIIHRIPGLTLKGLIITKALGGIFGARTVISALFSHIPMILRGWLRYIKPDLILCQSSDMEDELKRLNCPTAFLTNGVDTHRFVPVSREAKGRLREKYGIDRDKFVILHVGHLKRHRGWDILCDM